MTKILLINCSEESIISDTNKGAESVAVATVNLLSKFIPDAVFSSFLNYSEGMARKLKLRVVRMKNSPHIPHFFNEIGWWFVLLDCLIWLVVKKYLHKDCHFLLRGKRLREYAGADIIIYLGMDYYSEDAGVRVVLRHSRDIWLGVLLGKPVVIWAISAGPFRNRLAKLVVKSILNRVRLITVRDSLSRDFLVEAGVEPSLIQLTSDPAFLLPQADRKRVDEICFQAGLGRETGPIICINPSHSFIIPSNEKETIPRSKYLKLMSFFGSALAFLLPESLFYPLLNLVKRTFLYRAVDSRYTDYKAFFARLIDRLIEEYNATILLLAHDQAMAQLFDDRIVTSEIAAGVKNRERVVSIGQGYSAEEIKGIIGRCDLFIGARFHATIAALSQGIPIICFPYYHKFALIEDLGQGKYICPSYILEEAMPRVNDAWARRDEIKKELAPRLKKAAEMAALNGELVRQILTSASSSPAGG